MAKDSFGVQTTEANGPPPTINERLQRAAMAAVSANAVAEAAAATGMREATIRNWAEGKGTLRATACENFARDIDRAVARKQTI